MAFPTNNWPPRPPSGRYSLRFYKTGVATANFSDNAFLFGDDPNANPLSPLPAVSATDTPAPGTIPPPPPVTVIPPPPAGTPIPLMWSATIRIVNDGGGDLEYSFAATADAGPGAIVHGKVKASEEFVYRGRYEAGIAVRGAGATYRIEAW